jgi:hypothetical protein
MTDYWKCYNCENINTIRKKKAKTRRCVRCSCEYPENVIRVSVEDKS